MNLLIVSHTPHYRRNGELVGWGATVREIDQLGEIFGCVVHLAPLFGEDAPNSAIPYTSSRVRMRPVRAAGGTRLLDKLSILIQTPSYIKAMVDELRKADVVHVRCPANISLIALLLLTVLRKPCKRWFKYAGNWRPERSEPLSYTFQRWWLRKGWHRGVVTVNGEWPDQPSFVHTFLNPCLNYEELLEGRQLIATRQINAPVRLIFAGRLDTGKGVDRVLHIMARLKELGVAATLNLIGDGEERRQFEQLARSLGIANQVSFHGWLPRSRLGKLYSRSHFILLPSTCSEGWPKVLSEAMAYGVVSIASNVGSIPQYFKKFGSGRTYASSDVDGFARSIQWYLTHPAIWKEESVNAVEAANQFSYANYLQAVRDILDLPLTSSRSLRATELGLTKTAASR